MKGRPDFYWRKSKEQGYPARSVFKLQEIQEKFHLVRPGGRILDLGASPGSWSLYLLDTFAGGSVTGVDLSPVDQRLSSRRNYRFLQGDFFAEEVAARIRQAGPFDAVLSDAAPSTTGNRTSDTTRSLEICRRVLAISTDVLTTGGNLAVKVFQGGRERELMEEMRGMFSTARAFKPKASRQDSMEIYFIGTGFRGPAQAHRAG
jgi:23S rRNA (uridine2552-2'-O)-methyltransferase